MYILCPIYFAVLDFKALRFTFCFKRIPKILLFSFGPSTVAFENSTRSTKFRICWCNRKLEWQIVPTSNDGSQGIAELGDNRRNALRQLTSEVYPGDGVTVTTETLVNRILLNEQKFAICVELVNQTSMLTEDGREVLLSAGSHRSPQALMLSGIGN